MKVAQLSYDSGAGWLPRGGDLGELAPDLVLVFGGRDLLEPGLALEELRHVFPKARFVIASTSGEMMAQTSTKGRSRSRRSRSRRPAYSARPLR